MINYKYTTSTSLRGAVVLGLLTLLVACTPGQHGATTESRDDRVALTVVPQGELDYYPAGEFLRNGYPAVPPKSTIRFDTDLVIAKRQVSQAEYAVCVAEGACKPLDRAHRDNLAPDLPAVGVSWRDATAYAEWLSKKTGEAYRLPTYLEWVYAAGSAYKEDVILDDFDINNPAQRWLAEYALESQRKTSVDGTLRPFGGFGVNDQNLMDMAGNVWEWTDTCHVRQHIDSDGAKVLLSNENCGVRVVAGAHRSYIPDFIRDAKSGACSVGVPPSHLGFRLVRDSVAQSQPAAPTLRDRLGLG